MRIMEKQNRTKLYAVLMLVVLGSVGAYMFLNSSGGLSGDITDDIGGEAQCSYGYDLQGVDEDGNTFDIPADPNPLQSAFDIAGVEATSLNVGVDWIASGEGVDWNTFALSGEIEISVVTSIGESDNTDLAGGLDYTVEKTIIFTSTNLDDMFTEVLILGSDIAHNSEYRIMGSEIEEVARGTGEVYSYPGEGWYYKFVYKITASVNDILGDPIISEQILGEFGLWIEWGAAFTLTGNVL